MTHEQFIGIETAKLAKQAGFDWECHKVYKTDVTENLTLFTYMKEEGYRNTSEFICSAPTQSVLQRWLRELHNLIIVVKPYYGKEVVYGYIIYQEAEGCIKRIEDGIVDRSYESTLEVAEKKCLTLLIEKQ